ncbi:AAA family ATPase [Streptomyces sp. NPDC047097]|uniref:ATP-binding protein n=1 Tax=Streptomyces sp. NPDC047097 TaxID=3155260 RepID=UPI00340BDE3D
MSEASAMLEREHDLAVFREALDALADGSGGCVFVYGAPGMGKSLLLASLRREARARGLRVLAARGSAMESSYAFGVVRQILARLFHRRSGQPLAGLAPAAARPTGERLPRSAGIDDGTGGCLELDGLYRLLAEESRLEPVVLAIDDLHWADESSLRFLNYLQPRLDHLPVLIATCLRPPEPGTRTHLLDRLLNSEKARVVRPAPLSPRAAGTLLSALLAGPPDPDFARACHRATAGNPLLLRELALAVTAEGLAPTDGNSHRVLGIGAAAVSRRVGDRLDGLPAASVRLAESIAVLDGRALATDVARLAGLTSPEAGRGAALLEEGHLIRALRREGEGMRYEYVHPLVQAAVYDRIDPARRTRYHARAAELFTGSHEGAESAAAHLLRIPATGDPETIATLWRAARDAWGRSSPEETLTYLRRCLAEPMEREQRRSVLLSAASARQLIDVGSAAAYLEEALALTRDVRETARLRWVLGGVLLLSQQAERAHEVWCQALSVLPADEIDLRGRLQASLINIPLVMPGRPDLLAYAGELGDPPEHDSLGARGLACVRAAVEAFDGNPHAVSRLDSCDVLVHETDPRPPEEFSVPEASTESWQVCSWLVLLMADDHRIVDRLAESVDIARRLRAPRALSAAHCFRGLARLWRGELAEARKDLVTALDTVELANVDVGRPFIVAYLAETLMETGDLGAAEAALDAAGCPSPPPPGGQLSFLLHARARWLRLVGRFDEALEAALLAGERWAAHGGRNPAGVPWQSEAALSLRALGRHDEARRYAAEELALAVRWGAPRALGRALRVSGIVAPEGAAIGRLEESVTVLRGSAAHLELAYSLVELGTSQRERGQADGLRHLDEGLRWAVRCGAGALATRARRELASAGSRKRPAGGPQKLNPSEYRSCALAAQGMTNREIAHRLSLTVKTVEGHLSSSYRKLDITGRRELAAVLSGTLGTLPAPRGSGHA